MDKRLRRAAWLAPVLAFAAWRILTLAVADHHATDDPARALRWRPDHPEALLNAAEQALKAPPDLDRADHLARRAAAANPLDGRAFRTLGEVADQRGDRAAAARLYATAVRHSPRDLPSLAWLVAYHFDQGDTASGLGYVDALLRVAPTFINEMSTTLIAAFDSSAGALPLAGVLAGHPPWRGTFLGRLARDGQSTDTMSALFEQLAVAPGGLDPTERRAYVERLVRDRRWSQARRAWSAGLPFVAAADEGVFDGQFELPASGDGFGWRFDRVAGASVDLLGGPGVGGKRALYVSFQNRRVRFAHVRQLLTLAPGRYRLSARYRLDGLRNERGLAWVVQCAEGQPPERLGTSRLLVGSSPWSTLDFDFDVPAQGCGAQWLRLELAARIAAETQVGGRAWFDDIAVQAIAAALPDAQPPAPK
jgi:tetratricopeptide (TPR) repeat protein